MSIKVLETTKKHEEMMASLPFLNTVLNTKKNSPKGKDYFKSLEALNMKPKHLRMRTHRHSNVADLNNINRI